MNRIMKWFGYVSKHSVFLYGLQCAQEYAKRSITQAEIDLNEKGKVDTDNLLKQWEISMAVYKFAARIYFNEVNLK